MHSQAIAKMLASSWVTSTVVTPRLRFSVRISSSSSTELTGIEPGRRLVEEQERRIERQRARDAGALLHAAGELGGEMVLEAFQAHEPELRAHDDVDRLRVEVAPLAKRKRDVLGERHRPEQRARLEQHAEARRSQLLGRGRAVDQHAAGERQVETDQVPEQRRLPAAAAAEDREHLAVGHREVEILEDHRLPVADREALDRDHRGLTFRTH